MDGLQFESSEMKAVLQESNKAGEQLPIDSCTADLGIGEPDSGYDV